MKIGKAVYKASKDKENNLGCKDSNNEIFLAKINPFYERLVRLCLRSAFSWFNIWIREKRL